MASIDVSEEAGVRYLHFGSSWIQGAMRIARPWSLELEYTREMMLPLLLHGARGPRDVLVIGLGAASFVRFLHRHYPRTRVQVVEIDRRVVAAAEQFFRMPPVSPPHLAIEVADAEDYVARTDRRFDLVLLDGFDAQGRAGGLDTTRFHVALRGLLGERGIASVNLLGRSRGHRQSIARMQEAYDNRVIALPPCDSGNVIVLATAGEPVEISLSELRRRALRIRGEAGLNLSPSVARLGSTQGGHGDRLML